MLPMAPILTSHSEAPERRNKKRTTINHGAAVYFEQNSAVHSCCVIDVTTDGASIELSTVDFVPPVFDVSFDKFRTSRRCRLIWRDRNFLGVAFES
jgi:hypothetical protein